MGSHRRSLFQRNTIVEDIKQLHIWLHFILTFHPSCRDIFGGICLVTLTQRFGELSRVLPKHDVILIAHTRIKMNSHDSAFFGTESLSSR